MISPAADDPPPMTRLLLVHSPLVGPASWDQNSPTPSPSPT